MKIPHAKDSKVNSWYSLIQKYGAYVQSSDVTEESVDGKANNHEL